MTNFVAPSGGPVHAEDPESAIPARAECRIKRQFRHVTTDAPVTCPKCIKATQEGRNA